MISKKHILKNELFLASVALLALSVNPVQAQESGNDGHSSASALTGDIVVTARKREESIQETPISITAFSSAGLEARGQDGTTVPFKLNVVDLGADPDGDPVTSCVVVADSSLVFKPKEPSGKNQKSALAAIRRLVSASEHVGEGGAPDGVHCIRVDEAVAATLLTESLSKRANRARTIVQGLISDRYVQSGADEMGAGWLWL